MALVVTVSKLEAARLTTPQGVIPVSHSFSALVTGIVSTSAYADGDNAGTKIEIPDLVPAGFQGKCSLWLNTIIVVDLDALSKKLDLYLSDQDFTAAADNAPFSVSDAHLLFTGGLLQLSTTATDYIAAGSGKSILTKRALAHSMRPAGSGLWAQLIVREAATWINGIALRLMGFLG